MVALIVVYRCRVNECEEDSSPRHSTESCLFCGFLCICLMFLYPVVLDHPCNYIVLLFLEITAANKSNVCTFAVLGPQQVPQPVSIQPANRVSA